MIRLPNRYLNGSKCIPRESGDDPADPGTVKVSGSYSPRERG